MPENFSHGEELKPMQYYSLQLEDIGEPVEDLIGTLQAKIEQNLKVAAVSAAEFLDKAVHEAIVQEVQKAGVTDLVIFDRDFVVEAIKRHMVHGRWVHQQRYGDSGRWVWRCSACRREAISPIISALKYCPSCGAKMDAKEVETDG